MTTFTTRAEHHIGIIEVTGSLNDGAVVGLRQAFAEAVAKAESRHVLVVADKITSMEDHAALVLVAECGALRAQGGNAAWVSSSGWTPTLGSIASQTLYMGVYRSLAVALETFRIEGTV